MFSILYCKSIGMHVLLLIAYGITEYPLPGNSVPANETCVNVSGEIICYFKGSEKLEEWHNARQRCNCLGSTLIAIRNRNDQDAVAVYLKLHMNNSVAWTSGKSFTYREWTWINGKPMRDDVQVQFQEDEVGLEKDNAALDTDLKYTAQAASDELPYICAYCNSSSDIILTDKCLTLINEYRTWYDARNQCFMSKGDLAVIGDVEHGLLRKLTLNETYWIGLRKKSWRFNRNVCIAESNDEIKYTNWNSIVFATLGECISIDASDGKWKSVGCAGKRGVVCQRSVSKESTSGGSQSSTPQSACLYSATVQGQSLSVSYATFISIVLVGISVIFISNIVVALVVRKYVYHRTARVPSSNEITADSRYQDLETTQRQVNPDGTYTELQLQPVYEEVSQREN